MKFALLAALVSVSALASETSLTVSPSQSCKYKGVTFLKSESTPMVQVLKVDGAKLQSINNWNLELIADDYYKVTINDENRTPICGNITYRVISK